MKGDSVNRVIVWLGTLIFILLEIYSLTTNSHYKFDFFLVLALAFVVYYYRARLNLHWFHFFLFVGFLVLHNLGTFGFYSNFYFGIEYDWYVHSLFGISAALIMFRGLGLNVGSLAKRWHLVWVVPVLILGISAMHELFIEFAGALLLGEGEGMLYIGAGDVDTWDTQKDLFFNFMGSVLGVGLSFIKRS
jgi:uncharacterized membrane protein YjdF